MIIYSYYILYSQKSVFLYLYIYVYSMFHTQLSYDILEAILYEFEVNPI